MKAFFVWWGPALGLGLYCGRIISERWAIVSGTSVWLALGITAVTTLFALLIVKNAALTETWPLFLLYGYVFYPDPYPPAWIIVGLVTAVCLAQGAARQWALSKFISKKKRLIIAVAVTGIGFLTLYGWTISPGLLPADNGEFQLIAANLGVAHPPGFPLYTMLGYLMTKLPLPETAAFKLNLLSVITSTATLLLVYGMVYELGKRHLAAITAVITLGTATTFWAQATTANIRSLTAFFAALAIFALLKFYRAKQTNTPQKNSDRWLVLFALALTLGFTHHLSLAFMGVVFVLFVLVVDPSFLKMPKRWPRPLLAALLGLLPLLYLPWRANAGARGTTESLATLDGFLFHFLGLGFQGDFFYFVDPLVLGERLKVMLNVMTFQFNEWLLLGMIVGLILLIWREWKLAFLLGLSFVLHLLITAVYRAPQTVEYMLPATIPAILCLGYAISHADDIATAVSPQLVHVLRPLTQLFVAILFVSALFQGWQHLPSYRQLHLLEDARETMQPILQNAPPDSTILANWHWVTPLWYLQEVEGQRPDVTVKYVAPGERPYGQTWAAEIEAEMTNGRDVIATWFDEAAYQTLPPPEPFHEAFWFRQQPRTELPEFFKPLPATLGDNIQLLALQLAQPEAEIWQTFDVTLAWEPVSDNQTPVSLSVHLLGSDGRSYAQSDQTVQPQPEGITLTQFRLTPRPGATPGNYTIVLASGENNLPVGSIFLLPMQQPPVSQNPMQRPTLTDNSTHLIGYDWDNTLPESPRLFLHTHSDEGFVTTVTDGNTAVFPTSGPWGLKNETWQPAPDQAQQYIPLADGIIWRGSPISTLNTPVSNLPQSFTSNRPLLRDYVASVRLVGFEEDGFHWAWCDLVDYVPAMGAVPTLKWITGSQITSPHLIMVADDSVTYETYCQSLKPAPGAPVLYVPTEATEGQTIGGTLILYDAFTKRPLPILDERLSSQAPWIPLGETIMGERP